MENTSSKRVYDAEDIQNMLCIGRTKVYTFLKEVYKSQLPFPVVRIGNLYRIPKEPFDKWLSGN